MSAPPPSYSESVQTSQGYPAGYQPSYGAVNTGPQGGPYPPQGGPYPPQGGPYPPQGGPYPPQGAPYPPQGAPYQPPAAGYPPPHMDPSKGMPPHQPYQYQTQSTTNVIVQPQTQPGLPVGYCPACRAGVLEDDITCLGVLCAILFFPIGIICCLAMRQRRCSHCGAVFG